MGIKSILLFAYLLAMNAAAYILMALDKTNAMRKARRVPEAALLLVAALGGSLGEWLGMVSLHHKTKHKRFMIGIPVIIVLQLAAVFAVWYFLLQK